ncbi:hypothetical protein [Cohnella phaseoli]|uniref:Uncharacterized protein n=1 Tax=Cohnella phaseoli TaxID=456490 RepID=A0A3D9KJ89_9BACL|nr:hypothetical protein [Cohnella phaseoli]RED86370.1 hypothetical protein DFP98_103225 [Cohnella phaseoli]
MSEAKLDLLLSKMDEFQVKMNVVHLQMNDFQLQLNSQGEHIRQLIHIVGATNPKLEELTEEVHQVKEDVAVLKADVSVLKDDVSFVKNDVFVLKKDSGQLKSGQETLLGIQKEQQKILERLSVRSISHEADIAELRKI